MEAIAIAGVVGKTSPVTTMSYKGFRDSFLHPPRNTANTLAQLQTLRKEHNPEEDIHLYIKVTKKKYCLNGADKLFWLDWPMLKPANFLTPQAFTSMA